MVERADPLPIQDNLSRSLQLLSEVYKYHTKKPGMGLEVLGKGEVDCR